jgi:hypothetical protein
MQRITRRMLLLWLALMAVLLVGFAVLSLGGFFDS